MSKVPGSSAEEFKIVATGAERDIRLNAKCMDVYKEAIDGNDEISVKRRRHLERYFREYCEKKDHRLTDEKFKREGKFPDGNGNDVAIYTFKAWQFRIYGAEISVAGRRTFVGVQADADKKQNKANQTLLKDAAKMVGNLKEYKE